MASLPSASSPSGSLPSGWTEHKVSGGQPYYYHAATGQSTYIRPLPVPGALTAFPLNAIIPGVAPKKKKEKPLVKTAIPETPWLRVKTTEGNVFYTHKEKKESVWLVPEEIKEQVEQLEQREKEQEERAIAEKLQREEEERKQAEEEERLREHAEIERVKQEVQRDVSSGKRKSFDSAEEPNPAKRKKTTAEPPDIVDDEQGSEGERQQSIVEEMSLEVEQGDAAEETRRVKPAFTVPDRVDLSMDEAKALFKTLLKEKDINPLHPWDKSLPLFISDPRYVMLPSVAARREAFDEYCRDTMRAQRLAKAAAAKEEVFATGDKNKDAYYQLLKDEVSSTRASWTEFRKKWKKDRRFFGWAGEHEREKAFREWLKDLANKKKKQAEQAERDFFRLLQEYKEINPNSEWKKVKHSINTNDFRYDAVGSATLREELFSVYLRTLNHRQSQSQPHPRGQDQGNESRTDGLIDEKDRKQRALREREEKVRRERKGIERQLDQTRGVLGREEGELEFGSLLTDAIREPTLSWEDALPLLSGHSAYVHNDLPLSARKALFYKHVEHLRDKYLKSLHASFAAYAPRRNSRWSDLDLDLRKTISRSLPVSKLKLVVDDGSGDEDIDSDEEALRDRRRRKDEALEMEFDRWQRRRNADARKSFNDMLNENAFLEFWGKMGKIGGEGVDAGIKAQEEDEEEGEGGGGKADMKILAKQIDEDEFGRVLKNDARWTAFDHMPEERMKWLREHMSRLSAPKLSVHVRE